MKPVDYHFENTWSHEKFNSILISFFSREVLMAGISHISLVIRAKMRFYGFIVGILIRHDGGCK
jgi:hypothetical protein